MLGNDTKCVTDYYMIVTICRQCVVSKQASQSFVLIQCDNLFPSVCGQIVSIARFPPKCWNKSIHLHFCSGVHSRLQVSLGQPELENSRNSEIWIDQQPNETPTLGSNRGNTQTESKAVPRAMSIIGWS